MMKYTVSYYVPVQGYADKRENATFFKIEDAILWEKHVKNSKKAKAIKILVK